MSKPNTALYQVALRHLSADGKKSGVELAPVQLNHLSARQVRTLLNAVADLAPTAAHPADPEIRIEGPAGNYVVQVKGGRLNLVSWASKQKGGALTPDQIFAAVTGEGDDSGGEAPARRQGSSKEPGGMRQKLLMVLLGAAILGVNCFTVWFVTRPPKSLLPKYRLLAPEPAQRMLSEVAGSYETGTSAGDRRLEIEKSGAVQRIKYGSNRSVKDKQVFTAAPAEAGGKPVLVTSRKTTIAIKDQLSVLLFGDTYTRVQK